MFTKSISVYPKSYLKEMNISTIYPIDFNFKKGKLLISGSSEYQVFLNGKLIDFGPAKAAHNNHRIDELIIDSNIINNRILILLSGYNANSFDRVNEIPFIRFELYDNKNQLVNFSSKKTLCFLNESRYQKVVRFSYQRTFSESYNNLFANDIYKYNNQIKYKRLKLTRVNYGSFKERNVSYPLFNLEKFKPVQKEIFEISKSIRPYKDRYMTSKFLKIFEYKDLEIDSNKVVSKIKITKKIKLYNIINKFNSLTFKSDRSLTGFINLKINVLEKSIIYIYFDELDTKTNKSFIDFNFSRNNTHNCITYELEKGEYNLISFAPYTAKFIRVCNLKGKAILKSLNMILFENKDSYNFKYNFKNKKINLILDACRNTFASNAVDIFTDCASRERAGWLCDSYFTSRSECLFTGENKVEKNFLENYKDYKYKYCDIPKYMIPMCYPGDFPTQMFIPNWSMFYVLELENYFKRTNDEDMLLKSKKKILNLLKYFKKEENEFGLLEDLKGWVFVEWSKENDKDHICGVNVPSNILYAKFLDTIGNLYNIKKLKNKSKKINDWLIQNAFDGKFFVDNLKRNSKNELVRTKNIGETTQYYAFYFDLINKENYSELFNILVKYFGPFRNDKKVYKNIYKSNMIVGDLFRLEILNKYNLHNQALNEAIGYCYKMAKLTGTLWEHDSISCSLNHGFASYIANIIIKNVTGIRKIDNINKKIYVDKIQNNEEFNLEIPCINKYIEVVSHNHKLKITPPKGYKIIL